MVFKVTEDGMIQADTLCNFVEIPTTAKRLVGDKHQVNISQTLIILRGFKLSFHFS